jgi:hypothetical protein
MIFVAACAVNPFAAKRGGPCWLTRTKFSHPEDRLKFVVSSRNSGSNRANNLQMTKMMTKDPEWQKRLVVERES